MIRCELGILHYLKVKKNESCLGMFTYLCMGGYCKYCNELSYKAPITYMVFILSCLS